VTDINANGTIFKDGDERKQAVMQQWVGLELARWMKDPTVGSAQKELQGDRNTEAHRKADQVGDLPVLPNAFPCLTVQCG
jgi:hypothetical protein